MSTNTTTPSEECIEINVMPIIQSTWERQQAHEYVDLIFDLGFYYRNNWMTDVAREQFENRAKNLIKHYQRKYRKRVDYYEALQKTEFK